MSVKTGVFEKDGKRYPTIELKSNDDAKFGYTFGLSKAKLIIENVDAIREFIKKEEEWQEFDRLAQEAMSSK